MRIAARQLGICLAALVGCGPEEPAIDGTWKATDSDGDEWTLVLEGPESVSGTYIIEIGRIPMTLRGPVTGSYNYPAVLLNLSVDLDSISACDVRGEMAESGETVAGIASCDSGWSSPIDFERR